MCKKEAFYSKSRTRLGYINNWEHYFTILSKDPLFKKLAVFCTYVHTFVNIHLKVNLYRSESATDIASRWVHRESNLMFTLISDKDQRKNRFRVRCRSV